MRKKKLGPFKLKLTKLESNNENLRTEIVIGESFEFPPSVGMNFTMVSDSLTVERDYRVITTSTVQGVRKTSKNVCEFCTMNSKYRLEKMD